MSRQLVKIGIFFCCLTATVFARGPPFETRSVGDYEFRIDQNRYRLPNTTVPETYDISLITRIDQAQFDFLGTVKINIFVVNTTRQVTVHTRQLTINNVQLFDNTNRKVDLLPWYYNKVTEHLTIPTRNIDLVQGKRYRLEIDYAGILRTDNAGFYRSSYINSMGTRTWIATTQFESTDARHAFPCYDEPAIKANFTIRIQHGAAYSAISNMPERRAQNPDRTVTTHFDTTPLTSSYLIAFIVSDFQFKENSRNNKFRHRVYATPKDFQAGEFAVIEGEKILNAIANYLHVPFSLPKMDQAAIPDFNAGAMENWGLVTYREEYLLWNQSVNLFPRKTAIVSIIAHEFGHQWFGNLVAPKWWNYIWLNEGFATLFEHIGTDLVHPEWNFYQYFVTRKLQPVFQADAKPTTRPMTYYVESPEAIAHLFDNIAYAKSGCVLRMFLHGFTEESFKKGLFYYLIAKQYDSAVEDDLFAGLQRAVNEDKTLSVNVTVKEIFSSWSRQKGFPVLHVTRNPNGTVTISQERYLTEIPKKIDPTTWWIPYNVASKKAPSLNKTAPTGWLARKQRSKVIAPSATVNWLPGDWVLFNQQQTGYYRVQYDTENWKLLAKELISGDVKKIHPISRSQLIDDLFEFTNTHRLPDSLFFDHIKYLKKETEYGPWTSANAAITFLNKKLIATPKFKQFKALIAPLVAPFYKTVGLTDSANEAHFRKYSRAIVTNLACEVGVESCLLQTFAALKKFLKTGKFDSQHNRGLIYSNGIRKANATDVNAVWTRFTQTTNNDERTEILISLGNIHDATVLSQYLNRSLVEYENIRFTPADRFVLVNSIAQRSQRGLALVLRLLNSHTNESIKLIAEYKQLLINVADRIVTKPLQTQFFALLKNIRQKYPTKLDANTVKRAEAIVNDNLKWLIVHQKPIENYLLHTGSGASQVIVSSFILIIAAFFLATNFQ